jgi:hypothetical protein
LFTYYLKEFFKLIFFKFSSRNKAAFVGLTDEWESSMKRYAKLVQYGDYIQNVRPSKHPELIDMGWEDEY